MKSAKILVIPEEIILLTSGQTIQSLPMIIFLKVEKVLVVIITNYKEIFSMERQAMIM